MQKLVDEMVTRTGKARLLRAVPIRKTGQTDCAKKRCSFSHYRSPFQNTTAILAFHIVAEHSEASVEKGTC